MTIPTFTTVCTEKRTIAKDVIELRLQKPAGFTFIPGQYVLFQVPLVDNPTDIQPRAFSIASSPDEEDLLFVAKIIPNGRASTWFTESVKVGTQIVFTGPFGRFLFSTESAEHVLMLAMGTGMAPFRSMLRALVQSGGVPKIDIIFGSYSEEYVFWADELRAMCQQYPSLTLHLTLSNPGPLWKGHTGWVQAIAPEIVHNDFTNTDLYACGNPGMTKDVKQLALERWGMDKKCVHVEGYI